MDNAVKFWGLGRARKRPHLIPIYDRVVKQVTGGDRNYWEPLRKALRKDGSHLNMRLISLRK